MTPCRREHLTPAPPSNGPSRVLRTLIVPTLASGNIMLAALTALNCRFWMHRRASLRSKIGVTAPSQPFMGQIGGEPPPPFLRPLYFGRRSAHMLTMTNHQTCQLRGIT